MPVYDTPVPIDLAVYMPVGTVVVHASDRTDTVVTVAPTNPAKAADRRGAEETKVDFDGQRVTITGPRSRFSLVGASESVDITVELPSGSRLTTEISVGGVRSTGRLGATRIKNSMSPVDLDTVGDLWVRAGHGNANVRAAEGSIEITADHGQIRVGTVAGDASFKASHGSVHIDECGGDLDAKLSYGDLEVGRALASVTAKTAYGSIQLGEISSGSVQVESGFGQIGIGVLAGVPAWLDVASKDGHVRSELDADRAPEESEQTVAVRARTQWGDITITRAR